MIISLLASAIGLTRPLNTALVPASIGDPIRFTWDGLNGTLPAGWTTGNTLDAYGFTQGQNATPTADTGPSSGVNDGAGSYYMYAACTSHPWCEEFALCCEEGDLFVLAYNGSACRDRGGRISTINFYYHMYGAAMGELNVVDESGDVDFTRSGDQTDTWNYQVLTIDSHSFSFEYRRGDSWTGDVAIGPVTVHCESESSTSSPPPPLTDVPFPR